MARKPSISRKVGERAIKALLPIDDADREVHSYTFEDYIEALPAEWREMWCTTRRIQPMYSNWLLAHLDDHGPYQLPFDSEIGIAGGLADGERHASASFFKQRLHFRVEVSSVYAERTFVIAIGTRMMSVMVR